MLYTNYSSLLTARLLSSCSFLHSYYLFCLTPCYSTAPALLLPTAYCLLQHGRSAPLALPKKELGRFLQRITDTKKRDCEREETARAKEAAKAARVEAEAADVAEASATARQVRLQTASCSMLAMPTTLNDTRPSEQSER